METVNYLKKMKIIEFKDEKVIDRTVNYLKKIKKIEFNDEKVIDK